MTNSVLADTPSCSLDEALALGRPAKGCFFGRSLTLSMVVAGFGLYGGSSIWILSPVYLDPLMARAWFPDRAEAPGGGAAPFLLDSTLFFSCFGLGAVLFTALADRKGRKLAAVAAALLGLFLSLNAAAASSFGVWSVLRISLGVPTGGMGACALLMLRLYVNTLIIKIKSIFGK